MQAFPRPPPPMTWPSAGQARWLSRLPLGLEARRALQQTEIANAAIDAGADLVIGHGPAVTCLTIEVYKGKPIFYGLGSFSFHTATAASRTATGSA